MSRAIAACLALLTIAAADAGPLPHAAGTPSGPGRNCGGGFTAARGDTLYSIARRCETSVAVLVAENRLGRPARLAAGQELSIPQEVDVRIGRGPPRPEPVPPPPSVLHRLPGLRPPLPPQPPAPPSPPPLPSREAGNFYHFQAGDTLFSLARWARTSLAALRAANPDVDPRDIEVGDPIRLPRGAARPEPLRLRERGRAAPLPVVAPAVAPLPPRPRLSPLLRTRPPVPPAAAKPENGETPGGMDDGRPEPDGM